MQLNGATVDVYLPDPVAARVSADGLSIEQGVAPRVLVADPNPPSALLRVPPPARATVMTPEGEVPQAATASFTIDYIANGGADLWSEPCYTFPESAKTSFNAAAAIWADLLQSSVPITIRACWANFSGSTLGYSGGGSLYRDFPGAPVAGTYYSASLANALSGSDRDSTKYDMHITYNGSFSWYYGTDGNTPSGQMDLMSVVLHEIAHGLNFSGSMRYSGGNGSWGYGTGYPNIYDRFARDGAGTALTATGTYANGGSALGAALTSGSIWFHGSQAMAANGGERVRLYAPSTWSDGSSYSHLDYSAFSGTSNRLMVFAISSGIAIHDPGSVTMGLLRDLGWGGAAATGYILAVNSSGTTGVAIGASSPTYAGTTNYRVTGIASGTVITLTAPSTVGSATFSNWSGCDSATGVSCTVTMNSSKTATAAYSLPDDDFPRDGSLPVGWIQPSDSSAAWLVTSGAAYAGSQSLRSGAIVDGQKSEISYTANFSAGDVSFARKISSELDYDFLEFAIDGVLKGSWSGEIDWGVVSYPLVSGAHTLLWRYSKDASVASGSDAAWIDSVSLPSIGTLISQNITFGIAPLVSVGGNGTVSATASSGLPVTFSSQTTGICTVSGSTVAGLAAGICTIAANQAGNATYAPAPQATLVLSVTAPAVPPGPPAITAIRPGSGSATIEFTPPSNNGGSPIASYTATCEAGGQPTRTVTGSDSPLTVRRLTSGVAYQCSVVATNGGGSTGAASVAMPVTPAPARSGITPILMLLLD